MAPQATSSAKKGALTANGNKAIIPSRNPKTRPNTHHCPDKSNGTHALVPRCLENRHAGYCQTCGYLGRAPGVCWKCKVRNWGKTRPSAAEDKKEEDEADNDNNAGDHRTGETGKTNASETDSVTKAKSTARAPTKAEAAKKAQKNKHQSKRFKVMGQAKLDSSNSQ